jgi:hypothetical protein
LARFFDKNERSTAFDHDPPAICFDWQEFPKQEIRLKKVVRSLRNANLIEHTGRDEAANHCVDVLPILCQR